jgi:hypothetical protein
MSDSNSNPNQMRQNSTASDFDRKYGHYNTQQPFNEPQAPKQDQLKLL